MREEADAARWRYVRECIRRWGNIPGGITRLAGGAEKCPPSEIDAACDLAMKICPVDKEAPHPDDLLREAAEALDDAVEYMNHHSYSPAFMREAGALARALRRRIGERP